MQMRIIPIIVIVTNVRRTTMGNRTSTGLIRGLQTSRHPLALAITIALAATPAWAEELSLIHI